jgi:hypothetical protein
MIFPRSDTKIKSELLFTKHATFPRSFPISVVVSAVAVLKTESLKLRKVSIVASQFTTKNNLLEKFKFKFEEKKRKEK